MSRLQPIVALLLGAGIMQGCSAPARQQNLAFEPVLRVRHGADQGAAHYNQIAKSYQEQGRLSLAVAAYTLSLGIDSRQLEARSALAAIHAQQGRYEEAGALLQQVVADYPALAQPYNNLGYVYYLQGDYDQAVATLQRAVALDAGYDKAHSNLTLALTAQAQASTQPAPAQPAAREEQDSAQAAAPVIAAAQPVQAVRPMQAVQPAQPMQAIPPVQAMPPAQPVLDSTPLAAAVAPAPAAAAAAAAAAPSRMELVELQPNVFELKLRNAVPVLLARAPATPAAPGGAPAPLPAPAPTQLALPARTVSVEITNGNGVTGMAGRIKRVLGAQGFTVSRVNNQRPYQQMETVIQYRPGYEKQARALKDSLQGYAQLAPAARQDGHAEVRLVLGKDATRHLAMIEGAVHGARLALNQAAR